MLWRETKQTVIVKEESLIDGKSAVTFYVQRIFMLRNLIFIQEILILLKKITSYQLFFVFHLSDLQY